MLTGSHHTKKIILTKISVCFQWMFWGYSLAYSRTASPFIGDMANFGLKNVMSAPSPGSPFLPEIVFCLYQMLFCACTVQLVIGGSFERGRILPSMIFAFCWATVVYCPIACWTWNVSEAKNAPTEGHSLTSLRLTAGSSISLPSTSPGADQSMSAPVSAHLRMPSSLASVCLRVTRSTERPTTQRLSSLAPS
jgi:hypothetical protein